MNTLSKLKCVERFSLLCFGLLAFAQIGSLPARITCNALTQVGPHTYRHFPSQLVGDHTVEVGGAALRSDKPSTIDLTRPRYRTSISRDAFVRLQPITALYRKLLPRTDDGH